MTTSSSLTMKKEAIALLSCICIIVIAICIYYLLKWLHVYELFDNKREKRMKLYSEYDESDPDDDMNNDNQLLRYLAK
jgi:hypothetical protein